MQLARSKRGIRLALIGLGLNSVIAVVKFIAGIKGNSEALVADAVESLADVFSSVIVWRGLVLAARPADEDHPYGHGKAEPLATAVVAVLLLLAAIAIAMNSYKEILAPQTSPKAYTLIVLVVVMFIKELMFRFVSAEARVADSLALRSDAWHHRSDAITSFAAAIGISVALLGGPNWASADDVAAMLAAGIVAYNGWKLLRPALDDLMDTSPGAPILAAIRLSAASVEGVLNVEKCIVRKMGHGYLVDMHVQVNPQMTVEVGHHIAHAVKNRVRIELPNVLDVLVHIEPFGKSPGTVGP